MKLPSTLQPYFWSTDIRKIDKERDRIYIINQILSYGGLEEWKWLFINYTLEDIKDVFRNHPIKTYRPATFNLVKNVILEIEGYLPLEKYVINTPRNIG